MIDRCVVRLLSGALALVGAATVAQAQFRPSPPPPPPVFAPPPVYRPPSVFVPPPVARPSIPAPVARPHVPPPTVRPSSLRPPVLSRSVTPPPVPPAAKPPKTVLVPYYVPVAPTAEPTPKGTTKAEPKLPVVPANCAVAEQLNARTAQGETVSAAQMTRAIATCKRKAAAS